LTTPTFLLLEYGFITDVRRVTKNTKGGNLNCNCFHLHRIFQKLGKPMQNVSAVEVICTTASEL